MELQVIGNSITQFSGTLSAISSTTPADRALTPENITLLNTVLGQLLDYYATLVPVTAP